MRFTYTYRSSDGQRHTSEIEAESRDAAFARVRTELGVKPIKVVATEISLAESAERDGGAAPQSVARWAVLVAVVALALAGGISAWLWARRPANAPYQVMTPQGPVTYTVAVPLARQVIPGDRRRIEAAMDGRAANGREASSLGVFRSPAETYLARFAEPGRPVGDFGHKERREASAASLPPTEDEFRACLRDPVRIASTDFTEVVDLKRIVAGMKREMQAYLAGGGTVEGYLAELEKRQRLEISYRERAEQKLDEMLGRADVRAPKDSSHGPNPEPLKAAYAYWLKANAQLQAMGIYPLILPDALRSYQMGLDIDE